MDVDLANRGRPLAFAPVAQAYRMYDRLSLSAIERTMSFEAGSYSMDPLILLISSPITYCTTLETEARFRMRWQVIFPARRESTLMFSLLYLQCLHEHD
jgi:hypothetical protein